MNSAQGKELMQNNNGIGRRNLLGAAAAIAAAAGARRASAEAAGKPVKIGVLGDFSASYASMSGLPVVEAVKLAVEDFGGSALGQPVEVIYGNTQLKPDIASGLAREWFDLQGVDAVIDLPGSAMAIAVMDVALPRKKIVFPTASVSSDITGKNCTPYTAQWTYDTLLHRPLHRPRGPSAWEAALGFSSPSTPSPGSASSGR